MAWNADQEYDFCIQLDVLETKDRKKNSKAKKICDSPLIHRSLAIGNNDLATFECLIRKISNNSTVISKTLFQAAQYGNLEMVQFLVENASLADVNVLNEIGETPLFGATYEGHLKIVNYLLDKVI